MKVGQILPTFVTPRKTVIFLRWGGSTKSILGKTRKCKIKQNKLTVTLSLNLFGFHGPLFLLLVTFFLLGGGHLIPHLNAAKWLPGISRSWKLLLKAKFKPEWMSTSSFQWYIYHFHSPWGWAPNHSLNDNTLSVDKFVRVSVVYSVSDLYANPSNVCVCLGLVCS